MVGDGYPMGIAAEIFQHIARGHQRGVSSAPPRLVDRVAAARQRRRQGLCQELQVSMEVELAVLKSLLEGVDEFAAKDFPQHRFGKEVVLS